MPGLDQPLLTHQRSRPTGITALGTALAAAESSREFQLSPGLRSSGITGSRAHEVKFLVSEAIASEVESFLRAWLHRDAHGDVLRGGMYRVTSVYCDTPGLEVYHRVGSHRTRKFRVRRYGDGDRAYLERKVRKGTRVAKRRVAVDAADVRRLDAVDVDAAWAGAEFRAQVLRRWLRPVVVITYDRSAMVGACEEGPMRLTFDRGVKGAPADGWRFETDAMQHSLLDGQVVCEFKFLGAMPAPFKRVAGALQLVPAGVSKYRRCIEALRLAGEGPCPIG